LNYGLDIEVPHTKEERLITDGKCRERTPPNMRTPLIIGMDEDFIRIAGVEEQAQPTAILHVVRVERR
jgi:hypothetical protein